MFKVMKQKDVIKDLERNGFSLVRNGEHKLYARENVVVIVPHSKEISPGVVHGIYKTIKSIKDKIAA